jgi:outer membrane protein OmpA-like peptidoglycan-associated protein
MKTSIFALVAAALVTNTGLAAEKAGKAGGEGPGVAIGTIAGAVLGGPVGFAIGGSLGGWLSSKLHRERTAKEEYRARYQEADLLSTELEALVASNENEMGRMRLAMTEQQDTYRDALRQALAVEVFFHTGESALDEQVAGRIEQLGSLIREHEDFVIVVEGYADSRGDESFNDQLSAERAASVRDALIRAGLPGERITTRAAGEHESAATEGDLDAMALERRVNLSVVYPAPRQNRVAQQ